MVPMNTPDYMNDYLGQQYDNCWHFVQSYYADLGVTVDPFAFAASSKFYPVETPSDNDLVIFESPFGFGSHCGIYRAGHILNHIESIGVIQPHERTAKGIRFYRLCGDLC